MIWLVGLQKNIYREIKRLSNARKMIGGIVWAVEQEVVWGGVEVARWKELLVGVEGSLVGMVLWLVNVDCMVDAGVWDAKKSGVYLLRGFFLNI